jgi:hypothetical protein
VKYSFAWLEAIDSKKYLIPASVSRGRNFSGIMERKKEGTLDGF